MQRNVATVMSIYKERMKQIKNMSLWVDYKVADQAVEALLDTRGW